MYIQELVKLHVMSFYIILDYSKENLGTKVNLSTSFHFQTDGQAEKIIQTLKVMLRVCALDFMRN